MGNRMLDRLVGAREIGVEEDSDQCHRYSDGDPPGLDGARLARSWNVDANRVVAGAINVGDHGRSVERHESAPPEALGVGLTRRETRIQGTVPYISRPRSAPRPRCHLGSAYSMRINGSIRISRSPMSTPSVVATAPAPVLGCGQGSTTVPVGSS